jgi:hypothetical protein
MANRKDEAPAAEPQVVEQAGPAVPVLKDGSEGQTRR